MIYFDNASTTKISKQALEEYVKASEEFFNPSSLYTPSAKVKKDIEECRDYFLKKFKAPSGATLIFTGSASESNNSVLNSVITRKDKKYIVSSGEHSSIHNTAMKYKEQGYNVLFIPLKKNGGVDDTALLEEVDETTALVSVIHVSNETGAINDISSLVRRVKEKNKNVIMHSDGVQAVGKLNINLKELGVDFYTISAHKINGPKGIGGLFVMKPNKFKPFVVGGGQEMNMRAGTENVPAIKSFVVAMKELEVKDYSQHKKAFVENLTGDYCLVSDDNCVDNIISVCFNGVRGETIQHMLEMEGFLVGTGSACNSKLGHNRVLSQIVPSNYVGGAIRVSFDNSVSLDDCKELAIKLSNFAEDYKKRINK
ncbi:MAG: aminotransferase class V-fold PLP-dependent enzyme [Clostridiales bacterium]|nr:aminotransferase class V-fold PLP-dependent enzyme [Clostridiales bacterium]